MQLLNELSLQGKIVIINIHKPFLAISFFFVFFFFFFTSFSVALYGSRAANGVILITTKKGAQQKGKTIGVEFSTGLSFEQVAYLPDYQNEYGGGNGGIDGCANDWEIKTYTDNSGYYKVPGVDGNGNPYQSFDLGMDYGIDESFGPAYATTAGNILKITDIDLTGTQYANQPLYYRPWNSFDSWDTENYGKSIEWKAPANDVKKFLQNWSRLDKQHCLHRRQ